MKDEDRARIVMHIEANDEAAEKDHERAPALIVSQLGLLCEVLLSVDARLAKIGDELEWANAYRK